MFSSHNYSNFLFAEAIRNQQRIEIGDAKEVLRPGIYASPTLEAVRTQQIVLRARLLNFKVRLLVVIFCFNLTFISSQILKPTSTSKYFRKTF